MVDAGEQKSYTQLDMLRFDDPVSFLKGVTPSVRKAWQTLGIHTMKDLLLTIPRRYDDFSKTVSIRDARDGDVITIRGRIKQIKKLPTFRQRMQIIRLVLEDETGKIAANFFNQPWMLTEFVPGEELFLSGRVKVESSYGKSLIHPLYEKASETTIAVGKLAPVYGLSGTLAQKTYRRLLALALQEVELSEDVLPADFCAEQGILPLKQALTALHTPQDVVEAEAGRKRLAFDELLTYQLALQTMKRTVQAAGAPRIVFDQVFAKAFVHGLPYPLTGDQKRVAWQCLQDMEHRTPMRRLLQGDVGSGKTVVAAFLAAHVARAGASVAILAPTDILARQHAETLRGFFALWHIPLLLVTRTEKRAYFDGTMEELTPQKVEEHIAQGGGVLVGTHALLEANRIPSDLALVIVDEQHRFGVAQRELLMHPSRRDALVPHLLSMTATPIPRSLALTLYGDLALSLIREKPKGRPSIRTRVCHGNDRERGYVAMRAAVAKGERVFVVCPLIDPTDVLGVKCVTEEMKRLATGPLQGCAIALLHGRLKSTEKESVMEAFMKGEIQVLVATSVIEVGIDVPKATVIAIEAAERFGLAQLHQLRGRVGRSTFASYCFLFTDIEGAPIDRLRLLEQHQDGLELAEADLALRGAGNLIGLDQSGTQMFAAARLTDVDLIQATQSLASEWLDQDPTLQEHLVWKKRMQEVQKTKHGE